MELLLNLAWLLLALPAYWLWRRCANVRRGQKWGSIQAIFALGCVLVLLFPVISATDDLHAMRAEMEDSTISKRTVRQASGEKHSAWVNRLQGAAGMLPAAGWLVVLELGRLEVGILPPSSQSGLAVWHAGRAPPFFLLG